MQERLRSTSTTSRSGRGTDPDEYDRVMGIFSAQPSEMGRSSDGNMTDVEGTTRPASTDAACTKT